MIGVLAEVARSIKSVAAPKYPIYFLVENLISILIYA